MDNTTNAFDNLLEKTTKHLETKKYLYKPKVPETYYKDDNRGNKKGDIKVDRNGDTIYKNITPTPHKNVMLSIAYNIALENYQNIRPIKEVQELEITEVSDMLLRYFSKKFYDKIGNSSTLIDKNQNYEYDAINKFKQIEYKLYGVIERIRNYHSHYVHEPSILSFEDYFDNHSSLKKADLEEAKYWFQNRFDETKLHLIASLSDRKKKLENNVKNIKSELNDLFHQSKNDTSKALKNKVKKTKAQEKEVKRKIKEIETTLDTFKKHIYFLNNENKISLNGQLFIATMFLYKRQAKTVLEKWRHLRLDKDIRGYGNTLQTFFTYYCMSESYSLNNYSNPLLKFRNITSKLTTIPYTTNKNLAPIYAKIDEINQENYAEIEKYPDGLKGSLTTLPDKIEKIKQDINKENKSYKLKYLEKDLAFTESKLQKNKNRLKELEKLQKKIMPKRNRNVLTQILLQYLFDHDLFGENIKIAIRKTITDRLDYYNEYKDVLNPEENLTALKNRKKSKIEPNTQKRAQLNEHFKELKRNFIFKSTKELKGLLVPENNIVKGFNFSIKKKNALIQYSLKVKNQEIKTTVTLSPQLLLKWVFIHLETGKNDGFAIIERFIKSRIFKFSNSSDAQNLIASYKKQYPNIALSKMLPRSIVQSIKTQGLDKEKQKINETKKINNHIINRIDRLEEFIITNNTQAKPWKYASKQKIDLILEFMNHRLRYDVFTLPTKLDEDGINAYIRHKYFNVSNYDIARQYFRFYGRYKKGTITNLKDYNLEDFVMPNQITALKKNYDTVFGYIAEYETKANSLEDIFNTVIDAYIKHLRNIQKDTTLTNDALIGILKINKVSNIENVNSLLKTHYVNSFALCDEVLSVKSIMEKQWNAFKTEKEKALNGKEFRFSEYAFIRQKLQNDDVKTNIDFIYEHILPKVHNKDKILPYQINRALLKLKTEELMLWNIAKAYWEKDSKPYDLNHIKTEGNLSSYQNYTSFNKVYKQDLNYTITIGKDFWYTKKDKPKNRDKFKLILDQKPYIVDRKISINIHVPAKRYDNLFLKVETELIQEYILWNYFKNYDATLDIITLPKDHKYIKNNGKSRYYNLQEFDDLIKVIYRDLKKSIVDIGALLQAEKRIITASKTTFNVENQLTTKYKDNKFWNEFFLTFKDDEYKLKKAFLETEKNKDKITIDITTVENYLIQYRNFAIHYQLQDPIRKEKINKLLTQINEWNLNESLDEYDEKE